MFSEVALKSREILPKIAKVAAQLFVTRGRAQTRIFPNLYASYKKRRYINYLFRSILNLISAL